MAHLSVQVFQYGLAFPTGRVSVLVLQSIRAPFAVTVVHHHSLCHQRNRRRVVLQLFKLDRLVFLDQAVLHRSIDVVDENGLGASTVALEAEQFTLATFVAQGRRISVVEGPHDGPAERPGSGCHHDGDDGVFGVTFRPHDVAKRKLRSPDSSETAAGMQLSIVGL